MSLSQDGRTNLYEMDVRGRGMRRLTNTPAIDTSPSYSNDGTQIVFNSDRGGSQQLYVMSAGGGGEKRISFGDGRYATPVWSPRGDYIAFTKIMGGSFGIGVMRPDGSGERTAGQRLPGRGPDMGAQWPGDDVLPPAAQFGRPGGFGDAARHRHNRALRTPGADADRCVGSGLVTLDSAVMREYDRVPRPERHYRARVAFVWALVE